MKFAIIAVVEILSAVLENDELTACGGTEPVAMFRVP